jgi:multidrug resistance efflux pump
VALASSDGFDRDDDADGDAVVDTDARSDADGLAENDSDVVTDTDCDGAREALVSLRTRRELARSRVEQRTLRAPHAGVIRDVRVRAGQLLEPGVSVMELEGDHATASVIASSEILSIE